MTALDSPNDLIARAQAGERAALLVLLEDSRPRLLASVGRRLPPYLRTQVAEEIVHDAFAVAMTKLAEFEWRGRASFHAWLEAFVVRRLADWRKSIARLKRDHRRVLSGRSEAGADILDGVARVEDSPSRAAIRREREDALHAAMEAVLTPKERAAIELRYFENLSVVEVTALLECAPGSVKNLCVGAKKKLRDALGRSSQFFSSR